jgi:hypothetical protein
MEVIINIMIPICKYRATLQIALIFKRYNTIRLGNAARLKNNQLRV